MKHVSEILPAIAERARNALFDEVIRPEDIGYTHPVFLQCFLPTRHSQRNWQRWQTNCGRASLVIRAGELAYADRPHEFEICLVPAGPKARFVVAYVNDYIQRHKTATVNMGDSLRDAMRQMDIPTGGKNGKELAREVHNFAASEIVIAGWSDDGAVTRGGRVAAEWREGTAPMRFWLKKDSRQRTIWQPEMTVSAEYFNAVRDADRLAPFHWPAMIALQHDTRAMDIHCFLTYRLRQGLKRPVPLHREALHALFGQDIKELKHFWPRFLKSLAAAREHYPQADIEVKNDCILLKDSPPLIPYRKVLRLP